MGHRCVSELLRMKSEDSVFCKVLGTRNFGKVARGLDIVLGVQIYVLLSSDSVSLPLHLRAQARRFICRTNHSSPLLCLVSSAPSTLCFPAHLPLRGRAHLETGCLVPPFGLTPAQLAQAFHSPCHGTGVITSPTYVGGSSLRSFFEWYQCQSLLSSPQSYRG